MSDDKLRATRHDGTECIVCYDSPATGEDDLCDSCRSWRDYWNSLSHEEQQQDVAAMARHATEERE